MNDSDKAVWIAIVIIAVVFIGGFFWPARDANMSVRSKSWSRIVKEQEDYQDTSCQINPSNGMPSCTTSTKTETHNTWISGGDSTVEPFWPEYQIRPGYYAQTEEHYRITFSDDKKLYVYLCSRGEYDAIKLKQMMRVRANIFGMVLYAKNQ